MKPYGRFLRPPLLGLLLSACGSPRTPRELPLPPPPEAPIPSSRLPNGVELLAGDRTLNWDDLQSGNLPTDSTVTLRVAPSVPLESITLLLQQIHDLGYLVRFAPTE